MRAMVWIAGVLMLLGAGERAVWAQATGERATESSAGLVPADDSPFAAGKWQLSIYGGAIKESFGGENETLAFGASSIEYFVCDDLSLLAEPIGYSLSHPEEDTYGGGLNIGTRWHFATFDEERFALYWEALVGYVHFADRAPGSNGTHSNFTLWTGPGAKWRVADNVSLIGGFRYFHLSNASRRGSDRNPSIDGFGGYGGLTIHF